MAQKWSCLYVHIMWMCVHAVCYRTLWNLRWQHYQWLRILCCGMPYMAHGMHVLIHMVGYVEVWWFLGKPEVFWPVYYNLFLLALKPFACWSVMLHLMSTVWFWVCLLSWLENVYLLLMKYLVVDQIQCITLKVASDTVAVKVLYPHKNFLYMS